MYTELQAEDRFDLVVLYISIKQIVKVEEGCSIDEIMELYNRNGILKKQPAPTKDWLKDKLNHLCDRRILVESRGRFKTVHREFSRSFIETAYRMNITGCSELLDEVFKDFTKAKEIMILWSWLKYGQANDYTKRWAVSLTIDQWMNLTNETIKHGLPILSILAKHLHTTTLPGHSKIANEVFKDKADEIADLINNGNESTLYYFNEMGATLQYHCKEVIKPIMDKIDSDKFAELIKNSDVEAFHYLPWLFNTISIGHLEWVVNFQSKLSFMDFQKIIERNEKGKIDLIYDLISFYRNYIGNIKRSEFKYLVDKISLQIKTCSLQEIRFPQLFISGMTELIFLEKEINQIVNSIDFNRVKKDFEEATPRYWGSLLSISMLNKYGTSTFSKDFVDALDLNKVVSNIEKHYEANLHEFRVIMYQLAYGSDSTKKQYAKALQPMVEHVIQRFTEKEDHEDILKAFYDLDKEFGKESCKKLNKAVPKTRKKFKKPSDKRKSGLAAAEKSGEDYVMLESLISLRKEESKQED